VSLTVSEFDRGVAYWLDETTFERDFHKAFYKTMAAADPRGSFTGSWWKTFLPVLVRWQATRGRAKDFLTPRAQERFAALSQAWKLSVEPNLVGDISTVEWSSVSAFARLVAEIKDVDSPVFTSKFCHFLAPRLFPVEDNAAMGLPYETYRDCFLGYQREWKTTPAQGVREELVSRLADLIGSTPANDYPYKNKVVELCLIGRKQARA
jgi:hypothetical protein